MTLVSHRAQFIFLKTHKTASTSVELALEALCAPAGAEIGAHYRDMLVSDAGIIGARGKSAPGSIWRNHMSARAVRALTGRRIWRDYAKITTVRNPYSRMVSMFHSRLSGAEREAIEVADFDHVRDQFRAWLGTRAQSNVRNKLTIGPRYVIDHVIFFEHLERDFASLAAALNLPPTPLPRLKTDRNKRAEPWREYYDDQSKALVAKGSAFEIAFFGYQFAKDAPNHQNFAARAGRLLMSDPVRATNAFRRPRQSLLPLDAAARSA